MTSLKTSLSERTNVIDSTWDYWDSPEQENKDADSIFIINDIALVIPPTHISIRKEDLTWQWKTLRTKSSTKVASGHGMTQVTLDIVFTPELLLSLHRLIVQFQHSPFCYVENKLLRDSVAPLFVGTRNMAFTMTGLHVSAMKGNPGSFRAQLDLRWFNYFPYGHNFLYRQDWLTDSILGEEGEGSFRNTIPRYITEDGQLKLEPIAYSSKTQSLLKPYDLVKYNNDIYGGFTLQSMVENHAGEVFDLVPLPTNMVKSFPVLMPSESNIYVRYINSLQQKALLENFDIDIYQDLKDEIVPGQKDLTYFDLVTSGYTYAKGATATINKVRGLHSAGIPSNIKQKWISDMLKTTKWLRITWEEYITHHFSPDIKEKVIKMYNEKTKAAREQLAEENAKVEPIERTVSEDQIARAKELSAATGLNPEWIYAVEMTESNSDPSAMAFNGDEFVEHVTDSITDTSDKNKERRLRNELNRLSRLKIECTITQRGVARQETRGFVTQEEVTQSNLDQSFHGSNASYAFNEAMKADALIAWNSAAWGLFQVLGRNIGVSSANVFDEYIEHMHFNDDNDKKIEISKKLFIAWMKRKEGGSLVQKTNQGSLSGKGEWVDTYYGTTETEVAQKYAKIMKGHAANYLDKTNTPQVEKPIEKQEPSQADIDQLTSSPEGENKSELTEEEAKSILESLDALAAEGYVLYDKDRTINNVFSRPRSLTLLQHNIDLPIFNENADYPKTAWGDTYSSDAVVTLVAGTLSHIVASIPIIGHEYPTHQHLGSVEPTYMFEVASLDKSAKMDGLSETVGIMSGVRSYLQENARTFRPIPDSYCLGVDSFITRLLGTWKRDSIGVEESGATILKKNCIVSRESIQTIEGSPGTSSMVWEVQETNPYQEENIVATGASTKDIELTRKKVLLRLNEFNPTHAIQSALELMEQKKQYGIEDLKDFGNDVHYRFNNLPHDGDKERAFVHLEQSDLDAMESIFLEAREEDGESLSLSEVANVYYRDVYSKRVPHAPSYVVGQEAFVATTYIPEWLEEQGFDARHREKALLERVENYSSMLDMIKNTASMILSENKTLDLVKVALNAEEINESTYGLSITPCMWSSFMYYSEELHATFDFQTENDWLDLKKVNPGLHSYLSNNRNFWDKLYNGSNAFVDYVAHNLEVAYDIAFIGSWGSPLSTFTGNNIYKMPIASGLGSLLGSGPVDHQQEVWNRVLSNYFYESFPLSTGVWQKKVVDQYFDGMANKLNIGYGTGNAKSIAGEQSMIETIGGVGEQSFRLDPYLGAAAMWMASSEEDFIDEEAAQDVSMLSYDYLELKDHGRRESFHRSYWSKLAYELAGIDDRSTHPKTPPFLTDRAAELSKLKHINGLLAGLADIVRSDYKAMDLLGLGSEYFNSSGENVSSEIVGSECYPDLDLPEHPYYKTSLHAISPDFYFWNTYDDRTGSMAKELLEQTEAAASAAIVGPRNMLKGMQKQGKDPDEYSVSSSVSVVANSTTSPMTNALVSQHEGSDEVNLKWHGLSETASGEWISMGPTVSPWPTTWMKDDQGNYSNEYLESLEQRKKAFQSLEDKIENAEEGLQPIDVALTVVTGATIPAGYANQKFRKERQRKELEKLKAAQSNLKPIVPFLSNWHGNVQYRPHGTELEYYEQLVRGIEETETFFGNRMGYVNPASELDPNLTDTRVAALEEYDMTFSEEGLQEIAKASSKDILSQKHSMKRAYPTFKLFFVEEDAIYNRILAFDDFHAFNGVKEFTVHQSRKNPADTATIILQNVAGTLDGTKKGVIADLDYLKMDESGNLENPTLGSDSPVGDASMAPSWVDSKSQPFGSVVMRPGLNVQLRAGYSNDPNMLSVLISGRVTDIQWNRTGDLVEITVQSFGTELVKYLKGRDNVQSVAGEQDNPIYQSTHQLLGSMMLSPELKHFGRWTQNAMFQEGESKDSTVDFVDYSDRSFASAYSTTNSLMMWIANNKTVAALGAAAIGLGSNLIPTGRVAGAIGKSGAGKAVVGFFGKAGGKLLAPTGLTGTRLLGQGGARKVLSSKASLLGRTRTRLDPNLKAAQLSGSASKIGSDIAATGAFSGVVGGIWRSKWNAGVEALKKAGDQAAVTAAINNLARIESRAIYSQAAMLQIGLGYISAAPATLNSIGAASIMRGAFSLSTGLTVAGGRVALSSFLASFVLEATLGNVLSAVSDATFGAYRRKYALTKSRLYLSPQDDNLYPPSPKDYMHFDHVGFLENPLEWTKNSLSRLGFGMAEVAFNWTVGSDSIPSLAEKGTLKNWYNQWTGEGQPQWVLDKRVSPEQCKYQADNSTIWEIFHEMSLRHPGWIYGTRPYGNRFRYTMFFGIPSQRYWSIPAGDSFISRMNALRKKLEEGPIEDEAFAQLYGDDALEDLRDAASNVSVQRRTPWGPVDLPGITILENNRHQIMTNKVLEEYLMGLKQRFVPFRRYHYLTSDTDIVHNGIINSNNKVSNAVSVLYNDPRYDADEPGVPQAVVELKASNFIPEEDIVMTPVEYENCRGYTMGLRYGIGSLLHTMREMYRGEILLLGNPRIRPWDICILKDEYNDIVGPVEVEAVVHMFSHETGFLTEIKPNAVVMANEISSYPILSAMQMFCMSVEDRRDKSKNSLNGMTSPEDTKSLETGFKARHKETLEENYKFWNDLVEQFNSDSALQERAGISAGELSFLDKGQDRVANTLGLGLAFGGIVSSIVAAKYVPRLWKFGAGSTWANTAGSSGFRSGIIGAQASVVSVGGGIALAHALKQPSLHWFIAAPILFAKCLEEEVISVMPLTKNGVPLVSGMSLKDPAMMWRHIFGKVYNYAQDTAIGLQDMGMFWEMNQHSWWEKWVSYGTGYKDIRDDFRSAAGGG